MNRLHACFDLLFDTGQSIMSGGGGRRHIIFSRPENSATSRPRGVTPSAALKTAVKTRAEEKPLRVAMSPSGSAVAFS